ncbi:MAG: pyruvate kinase, partial [Actinobacteria bacterium]|nr:pyruvate kinase [Actinomycetota bacterium]
MTRRTKIVATVGPASESPDALEALIRAGVDVFRLNLSHGTLEEHLERVV